MYPHVCTHKENITAKHLIVRNYFNAHLDIVTERPALNGTCGSWSKMIMHHVDIIQDIYVFITPRNISLLNLEVEKLTSSRINTLMAYDSRLAVFAEDEGYIFQEACGCSWKLTDTVFIKTNRGITSLYHVYHKFVSLFLS